MGLSKKEKKIESKDSSGSEISDISFKKKMTLLNLNHLLDFCYNLFFIKQAYDTSRPFLKVTKNFANNLPEFFFTNEIKLKQILINLLSNAYKFTVSGMICLDVKMITQDNKSKVRFSVIDTGTGLDKSEIKSIFKPFGMLDRTQGHNNQGSGLGLCIVADILELFESKINLKSEVGKGSTFSFELENKKTFPTQSLYNQIFENEEYDDFNSLTKLNTELVGESNYYYLFLFFIFRVPNIY